MKRVHNDDEESLKNALSVLVDVNGDPAAIRAACIYLGLPSDGPVSLLRDSLAARLAVGSRSKNRKVVPVSARLTRGTAPSSNSSDTFLACPRSMLSAVLLPCIDLEDLFSLARTCTYMTAICLSEVTKRMQLILGPLVADPSLVTPVVASAYIKLNAVGFKMYKIRGGLPEISSLRARRSCDFLGIEVASVNRQVFSIAWEQCTRLETRNLRVRSPLGVADLACVAEAIRIHGSIEKANHLRLAAKKEEIAAKKTAEEEKEARLRKLEIELFYGLGMFKITARRDSIEPSGLAGEVLINLLALKNIQGFCTHVLEGSRSFLAANVARELAGISPGYQRFATDADIRERILVMARSVAKYTTCENVTRMKCWIRAFFSADPREFGAVYSAMHPLTASYIDALVKWIADTEALPVYRVWPSDTFFVVALHFNETESPASLYVLDIWNEKMQQFCQNCRKTVKPVGTMSETRWEAFEGAPLGVKLKKSEVKASSAPLIVACTRHACP